MVFPTLCLKRLPEALGSVQSDRQCALPDFTDEGWGSPPIGTQRCFPSNNVAARGISIDVRLNTVPRRLIALVLLVFVPISALLAFMIWRFAHDMLEARKDTLTVNAHALAVAVDAEIQKHVITAVNLSHATILKEGRLESFHDLARQDLTQLAGSRLLLVDGAGRQILNTSQTFGAPLPDIDMATILDQRPASKEFWISNIATGLLDEAPAAGVIVPMPQEVAGGGYLVVVINPDNLMRSLYAATLPEGWFSGIIDRNGNHLARNIDHHRLLGKPANAAWRNAARASPEGLIDTVTFEGEPVRMYFISSKLSGWSTGIGVAKRQLWVAIRSAILGISMVTVGILAITLMLVVLAGSGIIRPMRSLEHAALALGEGKSPAVGPTGLREVDRALDAFNVAVKSLADHDRRQKLLVGELSHRVKNILALIHALAKLSSRTAPSLPEFLESFEQRILGLSRTHDLLTNGGWTGAPIGEVLELELAAFTGTLSSQVHLAGPPIELSPRQTWSFSMIVHELATNAAKYGALASPVGMLEIVWKKDGAGSNRRLTLDWRERGCGESAPQEPAQPPYEGFGTVMIRRIVQYELKGTIKMDFSANEFHCLIEFLVKDGASDDEAKEKGKSPNAESPNAEPPNAETPPV
ncbi:MAG: hypothetical protein EPO23_07375 [Xanthobacteraceae bacterium]|nr:MAG: hypothetical protein EPO23_07375 [Xanthobacteraceae bacterium]